MIATAWEQPMDQLTEERKRAADDRGLIVDLENMEFETDGGIGTEAALGLLVLETDQTIEDEFRFLLPPTGVALHGARLHNQARITPETLAEMEARIEPTARLLPAIELGVIGFASTSRPLAIGEAKVPPPLPPPRPQ